MRYVDEGPSPMIYQNDVTANLTPNHAGMARMSWLWLPLTVHKKHNSFLSYSGHVDRRTRVGRRVVGVTGKYLQTPGLRDEVMRVSVGR